MTAAVAIEKSDAMPQARQVRFGRTAASYTAAAAGRIALLVAQVIRQLRTQRPLQQRLLQLGGSARHHPTGPPAVLGRPEAHSDLEASAGPTRRIHRVWFAARFGAMVVAGCSAGTAAGSEGPGSRGVFPEPENPFHVLLNLKSVSRARSNTLSRTTPCRGQRSASPLVVPATAAWRPGLRPCGAPSCRCAIRRSGSR